MYVSTCRAPQPNQAQSNHRPAPNLDQPGEGEPGIEPLRVPHVPRYPVTVLILLHRKLLRQLCEQPWVPDLPSLAQPLVESWQALRALRQHTRNELLRLFAGLPGRRGAESGGEERKGAGLLLGSVGGRGRGPRVTVAAEAALSW